MINICLSIQANCEQFSVSLAIHPLLQLAGHLISSAHPQLPSPLILHHRKFDVAPTTKPQISDSHRNPFPHCQTAHETTGSWIPVSMASVDSPPRT